MDIFFNAFKILFNLRENPFQPFRRASAEGRAAAQEALWKRLNSITPGYSSGPDQLENLAAFVRGEVQDDACGPLVQQVVGELFSATFKASAESWNAAFVLNEALHTLNPGTACFVGDHQESR